MIPSVQGTIHWNYRYLIYCCSAGNTSPEFPNPTPSIECFKLGMKLFNYISFKCTTLYTTVSTITNLVIIPYITMLVIPFTYFPCFPLPSPLIIINLISVLWVCFLFELLSFFVCFFKIPHMGEILWCLSDLFSLTVISSRSIHIVANGRISFFFMAELYSLCVCVYSHVHVLHHLYPFIHRWTLRLLPCLSCCK